MTSLKQIEANRRNALSSTGPKSEDGKRHCRRNAMRHGLTAETIIEDLEDAEDYKGFEAAIILDYDAQSAVERELVRQRRVFSPQPHSFGRPGQDLIRGGSGGRAAQQIRHSQP